MLKSLKTTCVFSLPCLLFTLYSCTPLSYANLAVINNTAEPVILSLYNEQTTVSTNTIPSLQYQALLNQLDVGEYFIHHYTDPDDFFKLDAKHPLKNKTVSLQGGSINIFIIHQNGSVDTSATNKVMYAQPQFYLINNSKATVQYFKIAAAWTSDPVFEVKDLAPGSVSPTTPFIAGKYSAYFLFAGKTYHDEYEYSTNADGTLRMTDFDAKHFCGLLQTVNGQTMYTTLKLPF
jgi:hypothetical protein